MALRRRIETRAGLWATLAELWSVGRIEDGLFELERGLAETSPAALGAVAKVLFNPDDWTFVVVGVPSALEPQFEDTGLSVEPAEPAVRPK
jgi:predicted Zn-dependent peptidase